MVNKDKPNNSVCVNKNDQISDARINQINWTRHTVISAWLERKIFSVFQVSTGIPTLVTFQPAKKSFCPFESRRRQSLILEQPILLTTTKKFPVYRVVGVKWGDLCFEKEIIKKNFSKSLKRKLYRNINKQFSSIDFPNKMVEIWMSGHHFGHPYRE